MKSIQEQLYDSIYQVDLWLTYAFMYVLDINEERSYNKVRKFVDKLQIPIKLTT